MAEIKTENVTLQVADGTTMNAFLARPAGAGKAPGMMVFQEAFGVNTHIREVAGRVAREGYVAIAPELFHRTAPPGFEGPYNDFPSLMPHIQALTNENLENDIRAVYAWLQKDPQTDPARIASIGFCLGGRTSFQACATVPLQAAISFYGGAIGPSSRGPSLLPLAPKMHAPILFFWGGLDQHIPNEQTRPVEDAMQEAGKDFVNVKISFADHAFFRDGGPTYNAKAAALAWSLTKEFLDRNVKNPGK
jgi:carboxymethylenebutenolidase